MITWIKTRFVQAKYLWGDIAFIISLTNLLLIVRLNFGNTIVLTFLVISPIFAIIFLYIAKQYFVKQIRHQTIMTTKLNPLYQDIQDIKKALGIYDESKDEIKNQKDNIKI